MKNKKRGITMLLSIVLLLSIFGGCAEDNKNQNVQKHNDGYDVLKLGEMPIGMWVTLPDKFRTDEKFAEMRESGINFINGFSYSETDLKKIKTSLELAGKHNMRYIVSDNEISNQIEQYSKTKNETFLNDAMKRIEEYYSYPAYAGQMIKDEPGRSEFEMLNSFIKTYKTNYPGYLSHINMFPMYATGGTGVPYEQYVDDWLEIVKPNYYSYDFYPLLEYDKDDYFACPERENYYYNLDLLRVKTEAKKIPYWSFIQTLGFSNTTSEGHREPSREDIRWQVFTSFAFGVKGIQYFCYFTPSGGAETFKDAMIDKNGNKTVRYDYVKELNADFNSFGKILLHCDAKGIILGGVNKAEKRYKLYSEALDSYGSIISTEGKFVAGCFEDTLTKQKSVLFTTTTPREDSNVVLNFKSETKTVTLWRNKEKQVVKVKDGKVEFKIDKGEAVFVQM